MQEVGPLLGRLVTRLARRRFLWLAVAAALTGALALVGRGLVLEEDLQAFLPKDDPAIAEHARALRAFRGLDLVRIDLGPVSSPVGSGAAGENDRARLLAGASAFAATLSSSLVERSVTEVRPETGLAVADLARDSLPSLVGADTVAATASRFEDRAELDARLAGHFRALLDLDGTVYAQSLIARDPLGLEAPFWKRVQALQAVAPGTRLDAGRIVSADGRHVLFLVEPVAPASNTDAGAKLKLLLDEAARRANAAADAAGPGSTLRAIAIGGHFAHIENSTTIQHDAWLTSIVSLVLMLLVYALIFPRRWLIPLTVLPLAFGGVFGIAVCRIFMHEISAIAVGFGGILIGLADDFVVHLYYFYEVRSRDGSAEPAVAAVERIAAPTLAAGAAIAASFIALAASGFPGQRDLAIFAATSLAGTLAFCLLIQPLLLPRSRSPRPLPDAGAPLRAFLAWVERHERTVLAAVALATLVLGFFATRVRFEDDPRAIDARSAATHADEDEIGARWGDPSDLALVVARGRDLEAALLENELVEEKLEALRATGEIVDFSSIAALAPSEVTQERRRAAWRALWTEERQRRVREALVTVGREHHFGAGAFAPFLARIASEGAPVSVPSLARGPLEDLVGRRIATDAQGALVLTFVRIHRPEGVPALGWTPAFEHETGALVTTGLTFARALISLVQRRLAGCGALAFVVVLGILIPALRRPRHVLAAALPLAVGLVWSLGIFALMGTALNAVNFLIPVLTFGLSVDYVLFLASGYLRPAGSDPRDEAAQAQGAVVASGSTTLFGMASLLLAKHPALFSVGVVALVGTAASLVAIFLITPALLRRREGSGPAA